MNATLGTSGAINVQSRHTKKNGWKNWVKVNGGGEAVC